MDPASAIGTASAVLGFAEFTYKFISLAYSIAKSTDPNDGEFTAMKTTATQVKAMSEAILAKPLGDDLTPDACRSICVLASECKRLSTKILERISRIDSTSHNVFLRSALSAIRTICSREELTSLQQSLDSCSSQLRFVAQSSHNVGVTESLGRLESSIDEFKDQQLRFREKANEEYILRAVSFERMKQREKDILTVPDTTFAWIFEDTAVEDSGRSDQKEYPVMFREWLTHEDGIFHISGKLGSGKSALMKMLVGHAKTHELLRGWAGGRSLAFGSCFFWKPGAKEQKSTYGLVRSLLFDVLTKQRDLIPHLFPDLWNPGEHSVWTPLPPCDIGNEAIKHALQTLCCESTLVQFDLQICFFIDGLDELDDDHDIHIDLVDMLNDWARTSVGRVKLCVSSREHPVFLERLEARHHIRMQDLNRRDIADYVHQRLERQIRVPGCLDDPGIRNVCREIIDRSDGMFLWTVLVLRLIGDQRLRPGESVADVLKTITGLPRELQSLVNALLQQIPECERPAVAICLLYTTFINNKGFDKMGVFYLKGFKHGLFWREGLLWYYFLKLLAEDRELDPWRTESPAHGKLAPFTYPSLCQALQTTKAWIMSQCKGLLEIELGPDDETSGSSIPCPGELYRLHVKCTHRALHEYFTAYIATNWGRNAVPSDLVGTFIGSAMCIFTALPLAPDDFAGAPITATLGSANWNDMIETEEALPDPLIISKLSRLSLYADNRIKAIGVDINQVGDACWHATREGAYQLCESLIRNGCNDPDTLNKCLQTVIYNLQLLFLRAFGSKNRDIAISIVVPRHVKNMRPLCRLLLERGANPHQLVLPRSESRPYSPWQTLIVMCTYRTMDRSPASMSVFWILLQIFVEHSQVLPSFVLQKDAKTAKLGMFLVTEDDTVQFELRDIQHPFYFSISSTATLADLVRFCHPPNERELLGIIRKIDKAESPLSRTAIQVTLLLFGLVFFLSFWGKAYRLLALLRV